jgi:hypothetical protein
MPTYDAVHALIFGLLPPMEVPLWALLVALLIAAAVFGEIRSLRR